jgi:hypothetical protein
MSVGEATHRTGHDASQHEELIRRVVRAGEAGRGFLEVVV